MTLVAKPEQKAWIDAFVESDARGGILGLGTGVGKTFISVEIARLRNAKRVLIMGPESTFDGWANHVYWMTGRRLKRAANTGISFTFLPDPNRRDPQSEDYLAEHVKVTAAQCKSNLERCQAGEDGWYFVTRELFTTQTWTRVVVKKGGEVVIDPKTKKPKTRAQRKDVWDRKKPFDVAILDECQRFATTGNRGQQSWAALNESTFKIAASADWFGSDLMNMYQVAKDIFGDEEVGMNKARFKDEYMLTEYDHHAFDKKRVTGEQIPGFFAASLPLYVTAPPSVTPPPPEIRYVNLSKQERELYDQLEQNYVAMFGEEVLVADIPLVLRIRLRELGLGIFEPVRTGEFNDEGIEKMTVRFIEGAKSSKIDEIKSIMADHHGEHLLVLTHSAKWAKKAAADLGAGLWTGDVKQSDRPQIKADFLSGKIKTLVAVPEAFGVGTDGLQAVCNRVVIASRSDQALMNTQSVSRIARQGQKRQVEVIELIARDTFDEGVLHKQKKEIRIRNNAKGWEE